MLFYTEGLQSKFGFEDGDQLTDFLIEHNLKCDHHTLLTKIVEVLEDEILEIARTL